jgi:hypothetical protein
MELLDGSAVEAVLLQTVIDAPAVDAQEAGGPALVPPGPLSPWINTVESDGATACTSSSMR